MTEANKQTKPSSDSQFCTSRVHRRSVTVSGCGRTHEVYQIMGGTSLMIALWAVGIALLVALIFWLMNRGRRS